MRLTFRSHSGAKIAKAQTWGIPIVNHLWLEDCYAQWRDISPALDRYINFPPGMDFGVLLAEDGGRAGAGLVGGVVKGGRKGYDQAELDRMEKEVEEELQGVPDLLNNVLAIATGVQTTAQQITKTVPAGMFYYN